MATVFVFCGVGGHPGENWFPWLKTQLESRNIQAIVPAFPNTDHPILDDWIQHMAQFEKLIDQDTIFVGHSLGAAFALRLLMRMEKKIRASFLVAPVWEVMHNEYDPLMTTFNVAPYDWETILDHCGKFFVVQSDTDPYIKMAKSEALAKHVNAEMTVVPNAGHFNTSAGYAEFPLLRDRILALIKN